MSTRRMIAGIGIVTALVLVVATAAWAVTSRGDRGPWGGRHHGGHMGARMWDRMDDHMDQRGTGGMGPGNMGPGAMGPGSMGWGTGGWLPPGKTTKADPQLAGLLLGVAEEERMARDLYTALGDGARSWPTAAIARSEQHHLDLVTRLLDRYQVSDRSAVPGTYSDPAVQQKYDAWLTQGRAGARATYEVGIALETWDIGQLRHDLASTSQTDVVAVLSMLLMGSEHHLVAFQAAAGR